MQRGDTVSTLYGCGVVERVTGDRAEVRLDADYGMSGERITVDVATVRLVNGGDHGSINGVQDCERSVSASNSE